MFQGQQSSSSSNGGGWIKKTVQLSQSDVRSFSSGNDGYGYKMEEAQGSNKIRQIANVILKFNATEDYPKTIFYIYNSSNGTIFYNDNTSSNGENIEVLIFNNADISIAPFAIEYIVNNDIFLFADGDLGRYLGTATLIYDYRDILF